MSTVEVAVTTYYLEMTSPTQLNPKRIEQAGLAVRRVEIPSPDFSRFLYTTVGGGWYWQDRLPWDYQAWMRYLDRPIIETWVMYLAGTPAGYFELAEKIGVEVELVYFGLLPQFMGQGFGGHLLTIAIEQAWSITDKRVWLHTCTLDHPHALANYQARGFEVYKETTKLELLPSQPPKIWSRTAFDDKEIG